MTDKEKLAAVHADMKARPDKYDFPDLPDVSGGKYDAYNKQMEALQPAWLSGMIAERQ